MAKAKTKEISKTPSHGIQKLTDYQHARLRTEMYLGSRAPHTQTILQFRDGKPVPVEITWVPALYTGFRELLDNALDEVIGHGHGDRVDVFFDPQTLEIAIEDNGRGIPIDWDESHGCHLATMVMTHARAGRNFGDRGEVAGTNGIGASVVNFCGEHFIMEIHRDGKKFVQKFQESPNDGPELIHGTPTIREVKSDKRGTKITFKPSKNVFPDMTLPEEFIRSRIMEVAICNPLIGVYYNGERIKVKPRPEQNLFDKLKPITIEVKEGNFRSRFYLVPNWIEDGEHHHSIVNNIPAFNGGVHTETFKKMFHTGLLSALERESKKRKLAPNKSDVMEGVLVYNITNMTAPNFDSQSKTRLINEEVGVIIKKALENEELYRDIIKKNREWIDEIYERCSVRTMKKDAAEVSKLARKVMRTKVAGLMDATGVDRSKCILFLAEGLSAISGMASVRDPNLHGGLGLKGKVMNVNGETAKRVLDNQALIDIMNSLGLIIGERANRHSMRYGKVYLAHDMDPDGLNIGALLINFFHTYWPELFDPERPAFLHIFNTPYIIAEKGKQRKYWYSHDYANFSADQYKGWGVTRAKGLGTLTKEDWQHSLTNPVLYPVVNDGKMNDTLDMIFNANRAADRRDWIGL